MPKSSPIKNQLRALERKVEGMESIVNELYTFYKAIEKPITEFLKDVVKAGESQEPVET